MNHLPHPSIFIILPISRGGPGKCPTSLTFHVVVVILPTQCGLWHLHLNKRCANVSYCFLLIFDDFGPHNIHFSYYIRTDVRHYSLCPKNR